MGLYLINRILQSLFVLAAMSVIVFVGIYVIGDPVQVLSNPQATPEEIEQLRQRLGLDLPLLVQYWTFLTSAVHGDFGISFVHNEPALRLILEYLPATLELSVVAMVFAIAIGIPLGIVAGLRPDGAPAKIIMTTSTLGFSLPTFWVGLMLIIAFSVWLGWLPSTGRGATRDLFGVPLSILTLDGWKHILLPALNLAMFKTSLVIRLARAGTREVVTQDFIKFARASGLRHRTIVFSHILKNIMIPIVTVLGMELGSVIAFSVVTEKVFAWPGMGQLLINSIFLLDRPVVVAYLLVIVVMFIVINLLVDLLYSLLDPRVRYAGGAA
jgi:peptide/nickel transport system permease protein